MAERWNIISRKLTAAPPEELLLLFVNSLEFTRGCVPPVPEPPLRRKRE